HEVSGAFDTASQTQPSTVYRSRLSSFYEIHAAAIHALPHGNQPWAVPEVALGLSFLHAVNDIRSLTSSGGSFPRPQSASDRRWSVSPLVRVGVVLFPQSLIS